MTGRSWKIRLGAPSEFIGHEYWLADGERIGYHGHTAAGESFFGCIRYDNTEQVEFPLPQNSRHFHSNDLSLVVGDGDRDWPFLLLWRFRDGYFEEPRVALVHRSSFHVQNTHVHPRFSPDGKQVLFTSDASGYGNLFLVDIRDVDSLPELETVFNDTIFGEEK